MIPPFDKLGNFFPLTLSHSFHYRFCPPSLPRPSQLPLRHSQIPQGPPSCLWGLPSYLWSCLSFLRGPLSWLSQLPLRPSWMTVAHLTASEPWSVSETPEALSSPLRSNHSLIHSSHCYLQRFAALHWWRPWPSQCQVGDPRHQRASRGKWEGLRGSWDEGAQRGPEGPRGAQRGSEGPKS